MARQPNTCQLTLTLAARRSLIASCILGFLSMLVCGCDVETGASTHVELHGAGATFPASLYERWFSELSEERPELSINYEEVGSGAGVEQFIDELVDFAASNDPLTDTEIAQVDRGVRQLPMTSGAIVLAYHLDDAMGNPVTDLRLSRKAYAGIFLGEIKSWLDEEITRHNPEIDFPDLPIQVEYRLDSSGTTSALTRHLSAISQDWKDGPGIGKSVIWPVGAAMPKDTGVARGLRQVPGSIGYLSYAFARSENIPMAMLENKAGKFVPPTVESIQIGLSGLSWTISESQAFVVDPVGDDAYPIVTYSWILCYRLYDDPNKLAMIKELLSYGLQEGQQFSRDLGFIPLKEVITENGLAALETITLPQSADTTTEIFDHPGETTSEATETAMDEADNKQSEKTTKTNEVVEANQVDDSADSDADDVSVKEAAEEDPAETKAAEDDTEKEN